MFVVIIVALIILSCTVSLHYFQHFEARICGNKRQSDDTIPNHSPRQTLTLSQIQRHHLKHKSCNCALTPRDGETFDFFPASFFYYLLFQIMLLLLIIITNIIIYYDTPNKSLSDLLFTYSVETYHQPSIFEYNHSVHRMKSENTFINLSDYILIYSVMLLSVWESLFSFYKYYTTQFIVFKCVLLSAKQVIIKFMIYAILFCIIFNLQIHFYYYLFPVILMSHFIFNAYCTLKFSSILIAKYQFFLEIDERFDNKANENILNSVYLMRRTSMICCVLQTIYLALFTISYTVNTIYYLPILWSISGCIYTFNFVRNRRFILFKIFECKQQYKSTTMNMLNKAKTLSIQDQAEPNHNTKSKTSGLEPKSGDSMTEIQMKTGSGCNTVSSSVSTGEPGPHIENDAYDDFPTATKITSFDCYTSSLDITKRESEITLTKKTSKALEILGIFEKNSKSLSKSRNNKNVNIPYPPPRIVHSHSNMVFSNCPSISQPKSPVFSQSDITTNNKIIVNRNVPVLVSAKVKGKDRSISVEQSNEYVPKLPLRRLSSPQIPIDIHRNDSNDTILEINLDEIDYIDDGEEEYEYEEEDECVYIDYKGRNPGEKKNKMTLFDINEDDIHINQDEMEYDVSAKEVKQRKEVPLKLKHHVSTSAPDVSEIADLVEVMGSLNLFAKYGFCSRNSINSLYQLTRYQYEIKKSLK